VNSANYFAVTEFGASWHSVVVLYHKIHTLFDWVANGFLFAAYHLHTPWVMPATLLVDTFAMPSPSRRYRSALIGIIVHSSQSVFTLALVLLLVLR
jgi:hypothetical protein